MVDAVNALLKARYGPCLVDFTTITPPGKEWYENARHLNAAAQERRALAAYWALATLPRACAGGVAAPAAGTEGGGGVPGQARGVVPY